ncbi:MAG: pyridoxal phosphate-dependent aminotransferase [Candidatus Acetothermia bacterium]
MRKESYLDEILPPRHGGRVEEVSESRGIDPDELIDFSANTNPLAPPEELEELIAGEIGSLRHYPDDRYEKFRKSVAGFLTDRLEMEIRPESVIPGNGSVEVFRLILRLLAAEGAERVLIPFPTFSEYGLQSRLFGLDVERKKYEKVLGLGESELEDYDLVFLCNPNNPTGKLRPARRLAEFAARCREAEVFVVLDEAFIELSDPGESLTGLVSERPNLGVVRSLTKEFTIPGLRVGYGVFSKELANRLEKLRPSWNLNRFADLVGRRFLKEERELLHESRKYLARERDWLTEEIDGLGFSLYPSSTNFLLLDAEPVGRRADKLVNRCLDHKVLIRNAHSFYGLDEWHVRVAVKRREENRKLVESLKGAIG